MIDLERVGDLEILRQVAKIQDAELRRVQAQNLALKRENEALKGATPDEIAERMAAFERELTKDSARAFGSGSERRHRNEPKSSSEKPPQKGHGPTPQPELPIEHVWHELDAADQICPTCGLDLEVFKDQSVESEEIDVVEVGYVVKKHHRQKYRCQCGCTVDTAEPPRKLIPGGRYSLNFAVVAAADKYDGHLPLERQARRMGRAGLKVTSQALWDQVWALSGCFRGAIARLHDYLLSKELVLADETRWPLLGAKGRKSKNWFAWTLASEDAILHKIQDTRSNEAGRALLDGFNGVLVTDGYVVYKSQAEQLGYVQAHCWSHARRKFLEAEPTDGELATAFLDDIGQLFGIERELTRRIADLPPLEARKLREQVRDEQSRVIVNRIGRRAMEAKVLPRSPVAMAIKYLENRWDGLVRFVDDGRVPMTSNAAERALRGLVLGRSNHFGSRSQRGTEVAAIFYSLIESAKLNGLNPVEYLRTGANAHLAGETVPLPHELA